MVARRLLVVLVVLALTGAAILWIASEPQSIAPSELPARASADLANGETAFNAGGCAGCHASAPGDRLTLGGGRVLKSPFGNFHVPNISPHRGDGIGAWSEAQFVAALLRGTSPDGRHYYPSFPYTTYQHMRMEDARDLFAFIKTLPAVAGRAPGHELPFPFNIRRGLGIWKLLYLDGESFRANPALGAEWNRGAYLINALAHCAECHSPRNALGAVIDPLRFAGGPNPSGEGAVPNITQFKLGDWSIDDFATLLDTGDLPTFDSVSGEMRLVVEGTTKLSAADRRAMAVYLKSLAPVDPAR